MPQAGAVTKAPHYTVKSMEILVEGQDVRASLCTLAPSDVIPWHFHNHVTDRYFCLMGTLRIETRAPRAYARIAVGDGYTILPKTAHRISNGGEGDADCRFLLLQGVGAYDFNKVG